MRHTTWIGYKTYLTIVMHHIFCIDSTAYELPGSLGFFTPKKHWSVSIKNVFVFIQIFSPREEDKKWAMASGWICGWEIYWNSPASCNNKLWAMCAVFRSKGNCILRHRPLNIRTIKIFIKSARKVRYFWDLAVVKLMDLFWPFQGSNENHWGPGNP